MPWTKNMKVMIHNNKIIHVSVNDVTDDMVSIAKDTVTVKDDNENYMRISKNDPRFINGELVGVNKNKIGIADHLNQKNINVICVKVSPIRAIILDGTEIIAKNVNH